ncbi:MAG: hypothetical protein KDD33_03790 [Bdellovibrionales bacterium]|nr:hypothetical protein [Bdellovibrionales bacterium]
MKKISEIMEELGFRPDGSYEVKKAFIKNLIQQAQVTELDRQVAKRESMKATTIDSKAKIEGFEQLNLFDFEKQSS